MVRYKAYDSSQPRRIKRIKAAMHWDHPYYKNYHHLRMSRDDKVMLFISTEIRHKAWHHDSPWQAHNFLTNNQHSNILTQASQNSLSVYHNCWNYQVKFDIIAWLWMKLKLFWLVLVSAAYFLTHTRGKINEMQTFQYYRQVIVQISVIHLQHLMTSTSLQWLHSYEDWWVHVNQTQCVINKWCYWWAWLCILGPQLVLVWTAAFFF